jgi:glycosyltransferase involved in cell wall biosynthesis
VVIEAVRDLPDLDVELRIFGALRRGDEYVESLIRASRDDPRIVFAGTFPQADLGRILVEADYLVAPALWFENEPLVVKAAQHLGLPVIASDIGSLADMVDEGVDGRSVQPGDVKAWREAIRRAVNERTEWARAPRPQPNMDQHFMHLAAVYEEVVSSGAAVGR